MAEHNKTMREAIEDLFIAGKTRKEIYAMSMDFLEEYGVLRDSFKRAVRRVEKKLNKTTPATTPASTQQVTQQVTQQQDQLSLLDQEIAKRKQELKFYTKEAFFKRFEKEKEAVEKTKRDTQEIFDKLVDAVQEAGFSKKQYKPMVKIRKSKNKKVIVVQISDIHLQEIVQFFGDLKELNYYDVDIARKRMQYVFNDVVATVLMTGITDVRLIIQGDIVSGLIHDELKYSMDTSVFNAMISFAKCMTYNIQELNNICNLKIICVSGNHGRLTKRIEYKHKASNNLDYMFYKLLEAFNDNVNFLIPDETFHREEINGKNYIIHHGDFSKGGKNMTGAPSFTTSRDVSFIIKNIYNELGFNKFEAALLGHFHTSFDIPGLNARVIGNGALIGPNDYAVQNALASPACQNLLTVNEDGRVESVKKIYCNHIMN